LLLFCVYNVETWNLYFLSHFNMKGVDPTWLDIWNRFWWYVVLNFFFALSVINMVIVWNLEVMCDSLEVTAVCTSGKYEQI
jgi:hypothetical protein